MPQAVRAKASMVSFVVAGVAAHIWASVVVCAVEVAAAIIVPLMDWVTAVLDPTTAVAA